MKLSKKEWLENCNVSERDRELLSLAYDVLKGNVLSSDKNPWGGRPAVSPWVGEGRTEGIWNWDTAFHAVAISRFDTPLAESCIDVFSETQLENGMFPDVFLASGRVVDISSKPPVLPWASLTVYKRSGDLEFLRRQYDRYLKNERFWVKERSFDGMFFYSAQRDVEKDFYLYARYESGWDNSPRWDTPIVNLWPIDLNCYMVMFYRALKESAEILGEPDKVVAGWREKADRLVMLIEQRLFDEENGCYCDKNRFTGEFSDVLSPASFMPLYIGCASKEHAAAMERLAADPKKFFPGMPTVSYDNPQYSNDYWRGPTWLNTAFFAVKGLYDYGFVATAESIREFLLSMIYKNRDSGIFENYDSINEKGLYWHRFSWSAAFIIEFILGLGPDF